MNMHIAGTGEPAIDDNAALRQLLELAGSAIYTAELAAELAEFAYEETHGRLDHDGPGNRESARRTSHAIASALQAVIAANAAHDAVWKAFIGEVAR